MGGMGRIMLAVTAAAVLTACSPAEAESPATQGPPPATPTQTVPIEADFGPVDLTAMVEAQGAPETVGALLAEPEDPRWLAVLSGVGSGEQAWLNTVPLMAEGLDGEAAGSISGALSEALEFNAEGVLRIAGPDNALEEVCFPIPPSEEPEIEARREASHARTVAAVERINDPALADYRNACLEWLRP